MPVSVLTNLYISFSMVNKAKKTVYKAVTYLNTK